MNNLTKGVFVTVIIALTLGLIYLQLEIQNIQSSMQPAHEKPTEKPTPIPTLSSTPSPTPYVPPANVIGVLNSTSEARAPPYTGYVIFINGTVTNDSPNTAHNVGLLVDVTSHQYPIQGSQLVVPLATEVPLVNGSYEYSYGGLEQILNPPQGPLVDNLTLSTLSPNQTIYLSIAIYPEITLYGIANINVTPYWTNIS